jgi:hypothetical protein
LSRQNQGVRFQWLELLNLWVVGGALVFGCLLLFFSLTLLWVTRPGPSQELPSTAVLSVIYAPTATQTPQNQATPTGPTGEAGIPPSPPPGVIAIGAYVQVTDTGGEGLRLRSEPGLGGQVLLLASEAEVFQVTDGPREADGFTWWYLVGPFDETRKGWAVSNYLMVVQSP